MEEFNIVDIKKLPFYSLERRNKIIRYTKTFAVNKQIEVLQEIYSDLPKQGSAEWKEDRKGTAYENLKIGCSQRINRRI